MDLDDLATRTRNGLGRNQVVVGKDLFIRYSRSRRLGFVWLTEDLGHNPLCKIRADCEKYNIPLLIAGHSEDIGAITGMTNTKVYLFKKGFSGLKFIINQLPDQS